MTEFKIELLPPIEDGTNVRVWEQVETDPDSGIWVDYQVWDLDDFDPTLFLELRVHHRFVIRRSR